METSFQPSLPVIWVMRYIYKLCVCMCVSVWYIQRMNISDDLIPHVSIGSAYKGHCHMWSLSTSSQGETLGFHS